MTEVTVATRRVLTTEEKIAQLQARIAKDTAALDVLVNGATIAAAFANVTAGDVVVFTLGRAETKRQLKGTVIARGEVDGKDVVRVLAGEGLSTMVYQVKVSDLDAVNPVEEPAPEAAPAEDDSIDDLLSNVSAEVEANLNAVQL
jgi:NAD(P)-dependent dehydrogenase (short-subunit alcohol dehydrogenase family)